MRRRIMAFFVLAMMAMGMVAGSAPADPPQAMNRTPICHHLGDGSSRTIYVGQFAIAAHIDVHGDTIGVCSS